LCQKKIRSEKNAEVFLLLPIPVLIPEKNKEFFLLPPIPVLMPEKNKNRKKMRKLFFCFQFRSLCQKKIKSRKNREVFLLLPIPVLMPEKNKEQKKWGSFSGKLSSIRLL
jgi:hypothetical protein